jgi:hypothetical protein
MAKAGRYRKGVFEALPKLCSWVADILRQDLRAPARPEKQMIWFSRPH